jgi:hypothetical protein
MQWIQTSRLDLNRPTPPCEMICDFIARLTIGWRNDRGHRTRAALAPVEVT